MINQNENTMAVKITGCKLTWHTLHDYFVFLFHGTMRRHEVWLDLNLVPPRVFCKDCGNK